MAWAAGSAFPQQEDTARSQVPAEEAAPPDVEDPWQILEDKEAMAWAAGSAFPQQEDTARSQVPAEEAALPDVEEDPWGEDSSWAQAIDEDPWRLQEERQNKERAELAALASSPFAKTPRETGGMRNQRVSDDLPIEALRSDIVRAVRAQRVTILVGATGCGKSTRLPQFLMNEPGAQVLVTQPRRVAAVEIARRVASERGERIGQNVGYRISGETVLGSGKLQFATIGYVLTWFLAKPEHFGHFTHVIIDEVHERAADMEMFLLLTKLLMYFFERPKVVLMSATLQPAEFGRYFSDFDAGQSLSVPGRTFPVQEPGT
ncbi:rha-1 [Symbiodinium natans]|uniref:Rha-1 protein n=1 Tax=Symbiodinium natans TaxID=878477 RepID=A0A812Q8F3_9DINO|nr:rha-1 [Symbiodinium natans]